jgi:hypothetical protein
MSTYRVTFTDFHDTRSELPAPRPGHADAMFDDVPEDPQWEDFGTASTMRPWGWST